MEEKGLSSEDEEEEEEEEDDGLRENIRVSAEGRRRRSVSGRFRVREQLQ